MLKAAQGFVVNIGGGAARSPGADFSIGASVNAAMGNFSKALSQSANVTASTSMSSIPARPSRALLSTDRATLEGIGKIGRRAQAGGDRQRRLRRPGKAEDVATLALFLCTERARHIQGTAIAVDGGATVGYY